MKQARFRLWVPRGVRLQRLKEGKSPFPKAFRDNQENQEEPGPEITDLFAPHEADDVGGNYEPPPEGEEGLVPKFAFWSVIGAAKATDHTVSPPEGLPLGPNGSFTSKQQNCPWIKVGAADIVATAWYIVDDASVSGLMIDAFDVDHGEFVLDDFVTVQKVLDESGQVVQDDQDLTKKANDEGSVPTKDGAKNLLAYPKTTSVVPPVPFREWTVFYSLTEGSIFVNHKAPTKPDTPSGGVLTASKDSAGIAFAFYRTLSLSSQWTEPSLSIDWNYSVLVDGGGGGWSPGGPVPHIDPWGPHVSELIIGAVLAQFADKVDPELRARLLEISEEQVSRAADALAKRKEARSRAGWLRRAAPVLRNVARVALPIVGVALAVLLARSCGLLQ